jgi:hypothetical protein
MIASPQSPKAGECDLSKRFPCQVDIIESVHIQLDGSARELGFDAKQIAKSVHAHLRERVPRAVKIQIHRSAASTEGGFPPDRRSRFACTLWTVGKHFTVSMFVECGLEAVNGDWAVESRLLGHIRQTDLHESARIALANVVDDVIERLQFTGDTTEMQARRLARQPSN